MKTSDDDLKKFCSEWTRKLIHARLGEFIKCHSMLRSEESHRRVKGGLTLRDSLYCATTKKSKKELSYKTSKKNTTLSTESNKTLLTDKSIDQFNQLDVSASASTSTSVLSETPTRRSFRSRKANKLENLLYE